MRGRLDEALEQIALAYHDAAGTGDGHFTEGHDIPLLQEATAQLYSLQHDGGPCRLHTSAGAA